MFLGRVEINRDGILALVSPRRTGLREIGSARPDEARRRLRISSQQSQPIAAVGGQATHRNDVTGEASRLISGVAIASLARITDELRGRVEPICREQFAEITIAHLERRHGGNGRTGGALLDPLLAEQPEDLTTIFIVIGEGEQDRSVQIVTILIVAKRAWAAVVRFREPVARSNASRIEVVARETVGVKRGVAQKFKGGAMKIFLAALGDDAYLAAGRTSILGVVIGG